MRYFLSLFIVFLIFSVSVSAEQKIVFVDMDKLVSVSKPGSSIFNQLKDINKKIELVNGTSEDSLNDILVKCKNNHVTFFLDGHYSGKNTYQGDNDTPIKFELNLIMDYVKYFKNFVIIVDDFRCFELKNYPNKNYLINKAYDNNLFFTVEHDMFIMSSIIEFKK